MLPFLVLGFGWILYHVCPLPATSSQHSRFPPYLPCFHSTRLIKSYPWPRTAGPCVACHCPQPHTDVKRLFFVPGKLCQCSFLLCLGAVSRPGPVSSGWPCSVPVCVVLAPHVFFLGHVGEALGAAPIMTWSELVVFLQCSTMSGTMGVPSQHLVSEGKRYERMFSHIIISSGCTVGYYRNIT